MFRNLACSKITALLFASILCGSAVAQSTNELRAPHPKADKAWVNETTAFLSDSGSKHWIIGRSTTPCLSESEANEKACQDAARQIAGPLHDALHGRSANLGNREWFRCRIQADLNAGRFIHDRSVSKVHKPYGDLWSMEILVDASNDALKSIGVEYAGLLGDEHRSVVQKRMALVSLSAGILLLYGFLNAATKGYFQGRLRIGAAVSLIVSACMIVQFFNAAG